jgi:hypothetical protein
MLASLLPFVYSVCIGQTRRHTMKTFTVAGTSIENGTLKFRAANDLRGRITMLERCENTDILLIELPEPMSKPDAAAHLLTLPEFADAQGLLSTVGASAAPKAPKVPKAPKAAKTVAQTPAVELVSAATIARLVEEKRGTFPSFTEEQLLEVVTFQANANMKEFGELEPNF